MEIKELYLYRDLTHTASYWIRARTNANGYVEQPIEYSSAEPLNYSYVRIPIVLGLIGGTEPITYMTFEQIEHFFCYRTEPQIGTHLFLNYNRLEFVKTFLRYQPLEGEETRYGCRSHRIIHTSHIHCIYPILQNRVNGVPDKLCLGLHFTVKKNSGNRQFIGRQLQNWSRYGVNEITEDIFDDYKSRGDVKTCVNQVEKYFAIYVGAGARLLVDDYFATDREERGIRTVSLFQQGSFVIVEGPLIISVNCHLSDGTITNSIYLNQLKYRTAGGNQLCPNHIMDRFSNIDFKQCVIFLGNTQSQHNSICWRLKVNKNMSNSSSLVVPEGGQILAIEPWDRGFAEIYERHRYERLYESVLLPTRPDEQGSIGIDTYFPKYGYICPFPSADASPVHKILRSDTYGLNRVNQRDFIMNLKWYVNDEDPTQAIANPQMAYYQPFENRFPIIELERVLTSIGVRRPSVPPSDPPILVDGQLSYLPPDTPIGVDENNGNHYMILGQKYEKTFGVFNEYQWVFIRYLGTYRAMPWQWNGLGYKLGYDYVIYRKVSNQVVGQIQCYYFKPIEG